MFIRVLTGLTGSAPPKTRGPSFGQHALQDVDPIDSAYSGERRVEIGVDRQLRCIEGCQA
jgi:hypothetical protein